MPDAIDVLKTRRSVPPAFLAAPGPDHGQLLAILTMACRVPDHGKLMPWRLIVFEGEGRLRARRIVEEVFLARNPQAAPAALDKERLHFVAPVVVAVISTAQEHAKIPVWEQRLSAGALCQAMLIAVTALGFGASWLTGWIAYDREVLDALGVKPDERVAGFIHIGTPTNTLTDRPRPDLAAVTTRFL